MTAANNHQLKRNPEEEEVTWIDPEQRYLLGESREEEAAPDAASPAGSSSASRVAVLAILMCVTVSLYLSASTRYNGTFDTMSLSAGGDNYLWGKSHHDKKKKKTDEEPSLPPPQADCDAILEGVFQQDCLSEAGATTGVFASVPTANGLLGIGSSNGVPGQFVFAELDPVVPSQVSNCQRLATISLAPDWTPTQGVAHYNLQAEQPDVVMWSMGPTFCVFLKQTGKQCKRILKELEKELADVDSVNLGLYSAKEMC